MSNEIRDALKAAALRRWGHDAAEIALFRTEPLMLTVATDPEAADAVPVDVAIDDPGAFTHSVWVTLEAMVAGGMLSGQAVLDRLHARCWRDGEAFDGGTLAVQILYSGDPPTATFEAMLFPRDDGGGMLRSPAIAVAELAKPVPDLRGSGVALAGITDA